jgi:putative peptide zinc metalloprotease protein
LDGYYVLSDILEIPNLRMHGRMQLGAYLERWLVAITPPPSLLSGWRRPAATVHAAASVVFQFFWMGGLIIAVSMWARGLGVLLAVSAIFLWCLLPLTRWVMKVWMLDPPERFWMNAKRKRLLTLASILVGIVHYMSTTTSPLDRRVPVVVRFHNEQISRAVADAFVEAVYVQHGQRVEKGQLLIELDQPELLLERQSTIDDLKLAQQRSNQYRRNGAIALADAKVQEAESLGRRVDELNQRIDGLRVFALRDGRITTPNLQRMTGRYVRQGDELVRVSDPNEKEVLAAVSERDINGYQLAVASHRPANVRLRGGTLIKAMPVSLRPRARLWLPHPAMSALVGGPLAVQPSDDPNHPVQLVEPQLESVSPLDPLTSSNVAAGQRGVMTISDDRPLVARLYDSFGFDTW